MEIRTDFVSPIEQHWNEAAALRDNRTKGFHYEFERGSSTVLSRHRTHPIEWSHNTAPRPSSIHEHVQARRRSRHIDHSHLLFESAESQRTSRTTPVCVAPPDILPIYEQKQLFAAATNSRITRIPLSQNYHVNPSLFQSASNNPTNTSQHEPLTSTTRHKGNPSSSPASDANQVRSALGNISTCTSVSSISSTQGTSGTQSPRSTLLREKPIQRIECRPSNFPDTSDVKGLKPVVHRNTPVVRRRNIPEDQSTSVNLHKLSLRTHLAGVPGEPTVQQGLQQISGYNFRSALPRQFHLFDSDTASTVSDEFFLPIRTRAARNRQNHPRIVSGDDVRFGSVSNECSLEFRIPKFYSKEVADWSISSSYRQNRKCSNLQKNILTKGYVVRFATEEAVEEIVFEDVDSIIVPPRRYHARASWMDEATDETIDFNTGVRSDKVRIREPRLILETNLDVEIEEELVSASLSGHNADVDHVRVSPKSSQDDSDDGSLNYNDDFNCMLVMQLFNLIGRLTDELKQLESDCVEMRSELVEVKRKQAQAETVSAAAASDYTCSQCARSRKISTLSGELPLEIEEPQIPNIPVDVLREVEIPIALTRSGMKEKRKKTIREKVFGLGRASRSKQHLFQNLHKSNLSAKSRFSFDGESCDDFSVRRATQPVYDVPPYEETEDEKPQETSFGATSTRVEDGLKDREHLNLNCELLRSSRKSRFQTSAKEIWEENHEECIHGSPKSRRFHEMDLGRRVFMDQDLERVNDDEVDLMKRKKIFSDWNRKMTQSEAVFLDEEEEEEEEVQPEQNTNVDASLPPPPRRVIRPPDDLYLAEASFSGVQETFKNWMEFKSTKAPRLSPDTGTDLKVRFDVNVREKTYFKDEVPKMSSTKRLYSGFRFRNRMQRRLRQYASSLADKMRLGTDSGKLSVSGDYEDLDLLDQRVSRLAEQSNQLCRNLAMEARSGLMLSSAMDERPRDVFSEDNFDPQQGDEQVASYIDLSTLGENSNEHCDPVQCAPVADEVVEESQNGDSLCDSRDSTLAHQGESTVSLASAESSAAIAEHDAELTETKGISKFV